MAKNRLEESLEEEEDPSGSRGIARANEILRRKHYPSAIRKSVKEIIKFTPKEIGASPDVDLKLNKYLDEMKNEGYVINKNYKKMDSSERWNYFLSVLRENGYYDKNAPF